MESFEVCLLGDFILKYNGQPVTTVRKPRLQSLLAYLVMHRDAPQFRYHLAGILWPDSSEEQGHTNLRNLVFQLRRALPDGDTLILAGSQTLQWNPDIPLSVDVVEFLRLAGHDTSQSLELPDLESALALYRGDFLPSCYDEWASTERERCLQRLASLLDQLIDRYEDLRRYPEAIACCQRLVQVEPFHQNGYDRLMRLYAQAGQTAQALKTYQDYARLLKHELAIEPPAETQAFYERMRGTGRLNPLIAQTGPAPDPRAALPLVGRAAEWQAFRTLWKVSAAGAARLLLISGEAGIGKTRLAEELLGWAQRQGVRTAAAHCYASEGTLPFAPVVEWLRATPLPPLEKVWLQELSRLLPELTTVDAAHASGGLEPWRRLRLFEALARAVLGGQRPSLLLIEDLHWCDRDTLEWLHYLLRFDLQAPLLLIGTLRSEELDTHPMLLDWITTLRQQGQLEQLEIGPLDEAETGRLAELAAGKALEQGMGALIFHETEGNPLFIIETMRAELFKQNRLPGVQPLPYKARAVLEHRIRQLSPAVREMVLLAATIGRAFSLDVLRQASGADEAELIHSLDEMLHRRIVREIARDTYDFSHDKLREAAFLGLSSAHRQMLHRQVAEALIRQVRTRPENKSAEIAAHFEQAGQNAQAIDYYQEAALLARRAFANEQAIQHDRRALALAESAEPATSVEQLARLHESLSELLALTGSYPEALEGYRRALALAPAGPSAWRAQLYRKMSEVLVQLYQQPQAVEALQQAEQSLPALDAPATPLERQEWIQVQLARSNLLYWNNLPDQMDALIQQLRPVVDRDGLPGQHVELLSQQYMARMRHERYRLSVETVAIARHKLDMVESLGNPSDIAWAQFHLGFGLLWQGQPDQARGWLEQAHDAALRIGARLLQVRSLAYLSVACRQLGDTEAVQAQCAELYEQAGQIGEQAYQGVCCANQGWLAWRSGDLGTAGQKCAAANETWRKNGGHMFHGLADWVLLAVAVGQQDLEQAGHHATTLLETKPYAQPILEPVAVVLRAALQAAEQHETGPALQFYEQALEMVQAAGDL